MTDARWTGHDPEAGCGLILATGLLVIAAVLVILTIALAVGLWRP